MTLFRPSSGIYSQRSLALVQSLGFTTFQWSIGSNDWDLENPPAVEKFLSDMTGRVHNGAIYLFHSLSPSTAAIMPDFLDNLHSQGYTFILP